MKALKLGFCLLCLAIFASNGYAMSRWSEARGVYDDLCYLRQAHLFQRFGPEGIATDAARDDDGYFQTKLKEIGFEHWQDAAGWPCHTAMPGPKFVLQYPPGTGALLSLFAAGEQVVPLYLSASLAVCAATLFGIMSAKSLPPLIAAGLFGALAMYLMNNPAKASYSLAPTLALCAPVGLLTAWWLVRAKDGLWPIALIGFLLGCLVDFRVPNALMIGGYILFVAFSLFRHRPASLRQLLTLGAAFMIGMAPTMVANAVNAGNPLRTTYGGADLAAPELNLAVLNAYLRDPQLLLVLVAAAAAAWMLRYAEDGARNVAILASVNLAINVLFFLSHPIFTRYYLVPIAMLSLWSMMFAFSMSTAATSRAGADRRPKSLGVLP